ncbi:MAG: glutathione S-transferase [Chloroflexi bacterium]|nr:glutathione S-transferase [Chloroflexota bacterium]
MKGELPILYSFRRCPYAIRARLALYACGQSVELREIKLSQKVDEFVRVSAKAEVPVLLLPGGEVLDESLDIMHWALERNDPLHWLRNDLGAQTQQLIEENDESFKPILDRYKYFDRYPQASQSEYRQQADGFLQQMENRLQRSPYLLSDTATLVDMALMPFIRQFSGVEPNWFASCEYVRLREWLNGLLASDLFSTVMTKYDVWKTGDDIALFPR